MKYNIHFKYVHMQFPLRLLNYISTILELNRSVKKASTNLLLVEVGSSSYVGARTRASSCGETGSIVHHWVRHVVVGGRISALLVILT